MIEFTLPYPPTVNTYWRHVNNRTILSKGAREYKAAVKDQAWLQKFAKLYEKPVRLTFVVYRPDNRRRDLDNLLKSMLDSLTGILYLDDSQVVDFHMKWGDTVGGFVKVTAEEL